MKRKFAVPTIDGKLCAHFGHCEKFAIIETEDQSIINEHFITPPVHQPGVYPRFLAEQGVNTIVSGGMGAKAQNLFSQNRIEVYMGIHEDNPSTLVQQYLDNQLVGGENLCDH